MNGVILLDSTEEAVKNSGVSEADIELFKSVTVPMLCNYDDSQKLKVVCIRIKFMFGRLLHPFVALQIPADLPEEKILEELCTAIELFSAVSDI
jgi:hypothetical protein